MKTKKQMILIADSGSTKTDWRLIDGSKISQFSTIGFNPDFVTSDDVILHTKKAFASIVVNSVKEIFFYGSGCSSSSRNAVIENGLKQIFREAKINIYHDLLGAARAACGKLEGIAGILGTGSNSCLFDGKQIIKEYRSGGYIIGDEGGGVDIGKRVIKAFIEEQLNEDLLLRFNKRYSTTVDEILENLYKKPRPNQYLASFSQFAFHNKENPFIAQLIESSFQAFFDERVLRFRNATSLPLCLVGSVAFYYQEILRKVAFKNNISIGRILEKPISGLTLYHTELD